MPCLLGTVIRMKHRSRLRLTPSQSLIESCSTRLWGSLSSMDQPKGIRMLPAYGYKWIGLINWRGSTFIILFFLLKEWDEIDFCPINKFIDLVNYRRLDLGQHILFRAKSSDKANTKKPDWVYRSYRSKEMKNCSPSIISLDHQLCWYQPNRLCRTGFIVESINSESEIRMS